MAKKQKSNIQMLRQPAEIRYAQELEVLIAEDTGARPSGWRLSPRSVLLYLMGGETNSGLKIQPKYLGNKNLLELCIATLLTDRALLLTGLPGTAKSWLSEHLAAAISGTSLLMIQGSIGIDEQALRYSWNYAALLQQGPSEAALVQSPVMQAMKQGSLCRLEELTRLPTEVQDILISVLSEKVITIPELKQEVFAVQGFNCIATANDRDRGIHELSSALRRRFNIVQLPMPTSLEDEMRIITYRLDQILAEEGLEKYKIKIKPLEEVITIFRELRNGMTEDKMKKIKMPGSTLSTAEILSVIQTGIYHSLYFGDGNLSPDDLAGSLQTTIIKDPKTDQVAWEEYIETTLKSRKEWKSWYEALKK